LFQVGKKAIKTHAAMACRAAARGGRDRFHGGLLARCRDGLGRSSGGSDGGRPDGSRGRLG
jgi:hypothetical protein